MLYTVAALDKTPGVRLAAASHWHTTLARAAALMISPHTESCITQAESFKLKPDLEVAATIKYALLTTSAPQPIQRKQPYVVILLRCETQHSHACMVTL